MSGNNSNTTTTSRPSTDPEAVRTVAQTDHRHHPVPVPDNITGQTQERSKQAIEPIETDTSAYPENQTNSKSAASPEKLTNRITN